MILRKTTNRMKGSCLNSANIARDFPTKHIDGKAKVHKYQYL